MSQELKIRYAHELLKNGRDAYRAAEAITTDATECYHIALTFPNDPIVVAEVQRCIETKCADLEDELPTEFEFLSELWRRMQHAETKDYARLGKLYAEVRGFVKKQLPDAPQPVMGVLVVPQSSTRDDWEALAMGQQQALVTRGESVD